MPGNTGCSKSGNSTNVGSAHSTLPGVNAGRMNTEMPTLGMMQNFKSRKKRGQFARLENMGIAAGFAVAGAVLGGERFVNNMPARTEPSLEQREMGAMQVSKAGDQIERCGKFTAGKECRMRWILFEIHTAPDDLRRHRSVALRETRAPLDGVRKNIHPGDSPTKRCQENGIATRSASKLKGVASGDDRNPFRKVRGGFPKPISGRIGDRTSTGGRDELGPASVSTEPLDGRRGICATIHHANGCTARREFMNAPRQLGERNVNNFRAANPRRADSDWRWVKEVGSFQERAGQATFVIPIRLDFAHALHAPNCSSRLRKQVMR